MDLIDRARYWFTTVGKHIRVIKEKPTRIRIHHRIIPTIGKKIIAIGTRAFLELPCRLSAGIVRFIGRAA